jgi:hypothetical protein
MKKIIIILLLAVAIAACKKNNTAAENEICSTATIKYGGNPAADGLGWYIALPDAAAVKRAYPENLPETFKVDGLLVELCYVRTNKDFVCFCMPPLPKMVNITRIVRR